MCRVQSTDIKTILCLSNVHDMVWISPVDGQAMNLTPSQDTLLPVAREDQYIIFNANVEIQQYLEKMPKSKAIVF